MAKLNMNKLHNLNVDDLETALDALRDLTEAVEALCNARADLVSGDEWIDRRTARTDVENAKNRIDTALDDLAAAGL